MNAGLILTRIVCPCDRRQLAGTIGKVLVDPGVCERGNSFGSTFDPILILVRAWRFRESHRLSLRRDQFPDPPLSPNTDLCGIELVNV